MDVRLDGQVALVTGASRGIGLAIAAEFAAAGASVMITSRKEDSLRAAAESLQGEVGWFVANAGDADQSRACIDATLGTFGGLNILVNNAATNPYIGPVIDIDSSRASKTYEVNQFGPLMWTQFAWRSAMERNGGAIVNVASIGGLSVGPDVAWYHVTKAALIHLTRHLAREMAPGVRVNAVAPGLVKTDMARALWESDEDAIAERTPLRRLGEPSDIARAVLFLASDAASWVTGQTLVVDGGTLVRGH